MAATMRAAVAATALVVLAAPDADAHGAMLMPPPRNAIDSTIPGV